MIVVKFTKDIKRNTAGKENNGSARYGVGRNSKESKSKIIFFTENSKHLKLQFYKKNLTYLVIKLFLSRSLG